MMRPRAVGSRLAHLTIVGSVLCTVIIIGHTQQPGEKTAQSVQSLAWIAGAWEQTSGSSRIEEHWTPVAGNTMLGVGRTIRGDKTVFFEFLRIEAREDGIYYVAQPRGGQAVAFKLARLVGQEALFENLAHDNPKRILYRKNPDGTLTARTEGDEPGKPASQEFHYKPTRAN